VQNNQQFLLAADLAGRNDFLYGQLPFGAILHFCIYIQYKCKIMHFLLLSNFNSGIIYIFVAGKLKGDKIVPKHFRSFTNMTVKKRHHSKEISTMRLPYNQ
jgi:hypothetical protein